MSTIRALRESYQREVCASIVRIAEGDGKRYPNFADGSSAARMICPSIWLSERSTLRTLFITVL